LWLWDIIHVFSRKLWQKSPAFSDVLSVFVKAGESLLKADKTLSDISLSISVTRGFSYVGFIEKIVTPFGTGAKVCPKEYLGRRVYLVILRD